MIPLHLKLSGFLSYREPAEVDFTGFHLACISGTNGAGKSSLLDAVTWALFGQARKRDDSLVNLGSKAAEVTFTFAYEGSVYRVLRSLPVGKTGSLEFQVAENAHPDVSIPLQNITWRPLTEHSIRETQKRIEDTLRLDYETFINVSFFLQGKADQFAQQSPARRKEILGSILGLEQWEVYRQRAADRRKEVENQLISIDARLEEIAAELGEENQRKETLSRLEKELNQLGRLRQAQEKNLAALKEQRAALEKQAELVQRLAGDLQRKQGSADSLTSRLETKQKEKGVFAEVLERSDAINAAYNNWQAARRELEKWVETAARFHEQEKRRQPFLEAINSARVRLEQEREELGKRGEEVQARLAQLAAMEQELPALQLKQQQAEQNSGQKAVLEAELNTSREKNAGLNAENKRLKAEMDELEERINKLSVAEGASCPLCGQPLSPEHRQSTLQELQAQGTLKGDAYRSNQAALKDLAVRIPQLEKQVGDLASLEKERLRLAAESANLEGRLHGLRTQGEEWQQGGAKRLPELLHLLDHGDYAHEEKASLAAVDAELASLGYDAAAHEATRRLEQEGRAAEAEFRTLESARTAFQPLQDEVSNLQEQHKELLEEITRLETEHTNAAADLAARQASAPDLVTAQDELNKLQDEENRLHQEVGAARQKVNILEVQRTRQAEKTEERQAAALKVGRYQALERAFGRNGVPALLIEQALPEIEEKANELLDRLSDGSMSVRFITQSAYKAKKREDLKETLDIQISDGAGVRDYELYSGGEAFRANFAIRLALAEVLASRKGARLQMLVIDEGFGSQDEQGRQRLVQSIRTVQDDFARVLVITHLDELKDAFPARIEVEKGERGSVVRVV